MPSNAKACGSEHCSKFTAVVSVVLAVLKNLTAGRYQCVFRALRRPSHAQLLSLPSMAAYSARVVYGSASIGLGDVITAKFSAIQAC